MLHLHSAAAHKIEDGFIRNAADLRFMPKVHIVILDDNGRDRIGLGLFIQHKGFAAHVRFGPFCLFPNDHAASIDADAAIFGNGLELMLLVVFGAL